MLVPSTSEADADYGRVLVLVYFPVTTLSIGYLSWAYHYLRYGSITSAFDHQTAIEIIR